MFDGATACWLHRRRVQRRVKSWADNRRRERGFLVEVEAEHRYVSPQLGLGCHDAGVYPDDGVRTTVTIEHTCTGPVAGQADRRPARSPGPSRIGYACVAIRAELPVAVTELNRHGVHSELIFIDRTSVPGRDRPQLLEALSVARPGDSLVIDRPARLARSHHELVGLVVDLQQRQLELEINSRRFTGLQPVEILQLSADLERDLAVAAVRGEARYQAGRRRDRRGLHPKLSPISVTRLRELFDGGMPRSELATLFGVSRATVYRICHPTAEDPS